MLHDIQYAVVYWMGVQLSYIPMTNCCTRRHMYCFLFSCSVQQAHRNHEDRLEWHHEHRALQRLRVLVHAPLRQRAVCGMSSRIQCFLLALMFGLVSLPPASAPHKNGCGKPHFVEELPAYFLLASHAGRALAKLARTLSVFPLTCRREFSDERGLHIAHIMVIMCATQGLHYNEPFVEGLSV